MVLCPPIERRREAPAKLASNRQETVAVRTSERRAEKSGAPTEPRARARA
jgi:hypothetical protein